MIIDFNKISVEDFSNNLAHDMIHGWNGHRLRKTDDVEIKCEICGILSNMKTLFRITRLDPMQTEMPPHLSIHNIDKILDAIKWEFEANSGDF